MRKDETQPGSGEGGVEEGEVVNQVADSRELPGHGGLVGADKNSFLDVLDKTFSTGESLFQDDDIFGEGDHSNKGGASTEVKVVATGTKKNLKQVSNSLFDGEGENDD